VYQSELDNIQIGKCCDRLELRIRSALSHLQMKQKPCEIVLRNSI
jgi:hypothetical protein